jgi:cytoskeleton protein RodZ
MAENEQVTQQEPKQKELIPLHAGELLRSVREQSGLSLEQAAVGARLKPTVVAAIESGETDHIPSVYLRGHVRSYARYLDVDPAELEESLQHVRGAEPSVQSVFAVTPPRGRSEKWLKVSSYVAASALIATLAWQFTHQAVRFSQGETRTAQETAAAAPGAADGAAETRPSGTHLNASIASMEVLGSRSENTATEPAAEPAGTAVAADAATDETPLAEGAHQLLLETSADTWVEILDAEGRQLELDLVRADSRREYRGAVPFEVMLGRASAVLLSLDGEAVDLTPHTRGNVARLAVGGTLAADAGEPQDTAKR